jgi:hypothetical protein
MFHTHIFVSILQFYPLLKTPASLNSFAHKNIHIMKRALTWLHWAAFAWYVFIFGRAGLLKVILQKEMVAAMDYMGFNLTWTLVIGWCEVVGVVMMLFGILQPKWKNIGVLFLFPFAVGAFTAHMARQEYQHFYDALTMCVLSVVILATSTRFKMVLNANP